MQKLITADIARKLDANALKARKGEATKPVLKLFNPCGAATWLISERDPDEPDILFGLCDLGFGTPELGNVSLAELSGIRLRFGLRIERDIHFTPTMTLTEYADKARREQRIAA